MRIEFNRTPTPEQLAQERNHLSRKLAEAEKYQRSADHNLREKRCIRAGMWYNRAIGACEYVILTIEDGFPNHCSDIYDRAKSTLEKAKLGLSQAIEMPLF